jgi:hypothetical protein
MGAALKGAANRLSFCATAAALLSFAACTKTASPPPQPPDSEGLARSIVVCLLVEHEPQEYSPSVRRQLQPDVPAAAASYSGCTPEQKAVIRNLVRGFLDYEDSQYDDCTRWYGDLERALAAGDVTSRGVALKAEVLTDHTKAIVARLPSQLRQLAEYQTAGIESMPGIMRSNLSNGSPVDLSMVSAAREAAAKFDLARKWSYAKTYKRITQEELSGVEGQPTSPGKHDFPELGASLSISSLWVPFSQSLVRAYNDDLIRQNPKSQVRYVAGFTRGKASDGSQTGTDFIWIQKTPMPDPAFSADEFVSALPGAMSGTKSEVEASKGGRLSSINPDAPRYDPRLGAIICDLSATFRDGGSGKAKSFLIITKRYVISINAYSAAEDAEVMFEQVRGLVSTLELKDGLRMPSAWTDRLTQLLSR